MIFFTDIESNKSLIAKLEKEAYLPKLKYPRASPKIRTNACLVAGEVTFGFSDDLKNPANPSAVNWVIRKFTCGKPS